MVPGLVVQRWCCHVSSNVNLPRRHVRLRYYMVNRPILSDPGELPTTSNQCLVGTEHAVRGACGHLSSPDGQGPGVVGWSLTHEAIYAIPSLFLCLIYVCREEKAPNDRNCSICYSVTHPAPTHLSAPALQLCKLHQPKRGFHD